MEIIHAIQERTDEGGIIIPRPEGLVKGNLVMVKEGPFTNILGIFNRTVAGKDRIIILLEALGSRQGIDGVSIRKVYAYVYNDKC